MVFTLLKRPRHGIIAEEAKNPSEHRAEDSGRQDATAGSVGRKAWAGSTGKEAPRKVDAGRPGRYNRFAKFSQVSDPQELWTSAATALAGYAAQVGGVPQVQWR